MYDIHYNPNRKQQEKYKNMLKRKNKEIKRLKININTLLNFIKDMFDEEAVYNMCGLTTKEFIKYIKEELKMKLWKYKIIEYEYKSAVYEEGKTKIEYSKTLHQTNSKLLFYLIILCLKISGIKYDTIVRE